MSFSTAALRHLHPFHISANTLSEGSRFTSSSPSSYHLCSCSVEAVPFRAWAVMKKLCCRNMGCPSHRVAWFATLSCNLDKGSHELAVAAKNDGDVETEIARASVQRRCGGGSGIGVEGAPDFLAIPGMDPRNLRELVDKGFEDVTQLKQLYKDKFYGKLSENG